jgi:hypothetical protein
MSNINQLIHLSEGWLKNLFKDKLEKDKELGKYLIKHIDIMKIMDMAPIFIYHIYYNRQPMFILYLYEDSFAVDVPMSKQKLFDKDFDSIRINLIAYLAKQKIANYGYIEIPGEINYVSDMAFKKQLKQTLDSRKLKIDKGELM